VATPTQSRLVKFGVFEVDLEAGELRKSGMRQKLVGHPFQVLQLLLERPQEIVTREELQQRLWPQDTFVDYDLALRKAVNRLREVLGDDAENPRFIETIHRRGYRFIAPVDGNETAPVSASEEIGSAEAGAEPQSSRALRMGIVLGLAGAAFLLVLLGFMPDKFWKRLSGQNAIPQIRSIAVLPLQSLSGDVAQEYFSDGMTDALITDLAQIGSLRVISRTSSMQYQQTKKSLPQIARELNVDGIIEGTVQRSGDRVRITAQLIYGPSDKHLWANSYERDMRDVFVLEREVTEDIARQVQARLTTENQARRAYPQPVNPKALEAYLQGTYHLWRKGSGSKAAEYFQQAIDADPNFALAYSRLASSHIFVLWPTMEDAKIVKSSSEKALELDPQSSDVRQAAAYLLNQFAWDWSGAEEENRRAIALNPNNADAYDNLCDIHFIERRKEEGLKECEIAQELDPQSDHLVRPLYLSGQNDRAIEMSRMVLRVNPDDVGAHYYGLHLNYVAKGMYKESVPELEKVIALVGFPEAAARVHQAFVVSGYQGAMRQWAKELERLIATHQAYFPVILARTYTTLGDKDRAFYWLEEAYKHRDIHSVSLDSSLASINVDPSFAPLRPDPRYKDLLRRMGLPP
jgi:TolB-like protein/DNA-binding winged helix-turn-helix (wHTH) protein